ncbi:hypothetical protein E5676_scaffold298G001510 [Cucumis melo var. makuwa]|uniref:Uncharacterized protein n=1 Tax=Cucumis melo var. makuwa TaxID=1194695 RepID=A0A5D3BV17_CUCMM|nr:hypothetical protein E5676_scaffold298G001510 [Cucumis melo var. makuwa]
MSVKQALTEALMKYQQIVGKASLSNAKAEKTPSGSPMLEKRTEKCLFKKVVINEVEIQLPEDKLSDLLIIVSRETSKREEE